MKQYSLTFFSSSVQLTICLGEARKENLSSSRCIAASKAFMNCILNNVHALHQTLVEFKHIQKTLIVGNCMRIRLTNLVT